MKNDIIDEIKKLQDLHCKYSENIYFKNIIDNHSKTINELNNNKDENIDKKYKTAYLRGRYSDYISLDPNLTAEQYHTEVINTLKKSQKIKDFQKNNNSNEDIQKHISNIESFQKYKEDNSWEFEKLDLQGGKYPSFEDVNSKNDILNSALKYMKLLQK